MKLPERMITSGKLPAVKKLLLVGTALIFSAMITPAMADKPDCDEGPPCNSGGGGGADGTFKVDITGAVTGGSIADWLASFGGKKAIGNNVHTAFPFDVGMLDLSFFVPLFTDPGPRGTVCFVGSGNLNQAIIQKGKQGRAEGLFWFTGLADDAASTPVIYLLKVFGVFGLGDWPPVGEGDTTLTMDNWEMSVENVGKTLRNNSCVGEGDFGAAPLSIEVKRTN